MSSRFRIPKVWAQRFKEEHLSLPTLLSHAGLPLNLFDQDKILVTTAELFALWRAVGQISSDPGIGLRMGSEPRFERYHPTSVAAICSRSLRDALQRIARFKQLACPQEIRLRTSAGETSVEYLHLEATQEQPDVLVDMSLSWFYYIGRRGTDNSITPLRLELQRPARNRGLLQAHFGCPITFKARRDALVFRDIDLDRPFVTHNDDLLTAIGAHLETELQDRNSQLSLEEQARRTLKRTLAGKRPNLEDLAQALGMSTRTLQRRLADAGITFQQLVEDTRRELAHHYLKDSPVELGEAAFLLGFQDANSFIRAFQVWEGTSPGAWRQSHRPAPLQSMGN
jgi:AraC-like DNA-binding protein